MFFFLFVCFLSVHFSLVVTCCERVNLLALLYVVFLSLYPCGAMGQVWCLIVSIPDLCFHSTLYPS